MPSTLSLAEPLVPPISPEELARRNAAAVALLDEWAADVEGEQEHRETLTALRQAFGKDRVGSNRPWSSPSQEVIIATGNVSHLARFTEARRWDQIKP